jgi:hypothetical protein
MRAGERYRACIVPSCRPMLLWQPWQDDGAVAWVLNL